MSNTNYCQKNGDVILNRARDRLRQQARDKCKNLSEEKKNEERESMEKIDIIVCLKKKTKTKKISKKLS